jgi:Asp-tRNA(Asn)/Glu-tRNA(Gln) amidotransferase A subunit family amidase
VTTIDAARELNAFISMLGDEARGPRVAVKDLIDVAGSVTTGGGRVFPEVPAESDAPIIRRLRVSGCSLVAKTNLDEWAYGAIGANEHYGDMRNPRAPDRIAGGSSGGSAIAVATGAADWAIGTDTGGSIRIPASLCGVVGFKPTLGKIDRRGVTLLSASLDTVGALAPDVRTAVRAVEMMTGEHLPLPDRPPDVASFRIGIPQDWIDDLDETTAEVWEAVATDLEPIALGDREAIASPAPVILDYEAAARHGRSLERDPGRYGVATAAKLRNARSIPASAYRDALARREVAQTTVAAAMRTVDAIMLPVTPDVAAPPDSIPSRDRLLGYVRPFNTTGQPVIALPAPTPGLPVGIQVVAAPGDDETCAAVALALEAAWHGRR